MAGEAEVQAAVDKAVGEFMDPEGLAGYIGIPVASVYGWRYRGVGPRAIKVGRHLRYRRRDVEAWLEAQADQPRSA